MIKIALCDDNRYSGEKLEELLELAERHKLHIDVDCFEDGQAVGKDKKRRAV